MNSSTILFLTNDAEFEAVGNSAANLIGCKIAIGQHPADAARLLGELLRRVTVVIVDLDSAVHGSAWLSAVKSVADKVPAMAVSRLNPQFLGPVARRHGVRRWLAKPVGAAELAEAVNGVVASSVDESEKAQFALN